MVRCRQPLRSSAPRPLVRKALILPAVVVVVPVVQRMPR